MAVWSEIPTPEDDRQVLHLAAIDWCPHICPSGKQEGFLVDIVKAIYPEADYQLNIQIFPWSRAIKLVREGSFHGLLAPTKDEAPDLFYPALAIGQQQMCFFVERNNSWRYHGPESLKGISVGMATDTSIEELNQYKDKHPEQFQLQPYLNRFVKQNAKKIAMGRIDTFVFTRQTTYYELRELNMLDEYSLAGCVSQADVFLAFTQVKQHAPDVNRWATEFDDRMIKLEQSGELQMILDRYHIKY